MLGFKYLTTRHVKRTEEQTNVQTSFLWRDGGQIRTATFTGYMEYAGKSMPRGQYLQADMRRWVHESQFVGWVA